MTADDKNLWAGKGNLVYDTYVEIVHHAHKKGLTDEQWWQLLMSGLSQLVHENRLDPHKVCETLQRSVDRIAQRKDRLVKRLEADADTD